MKVVTTNLLNRFWKHGVIPIKDAVASKFDTSKIVKSANITEEGFVMDGKMASELYSELIGKFGALIKSETFSGTADSTSNIHVSNNSNRLYIAAQANVSARILIPFRYNGNHTYIRVLSNAGAAVPNTTISGVAWYIELN